MNFKDFFDSKEVLERTFWSVFFADRWIHGIVKSSLFIAFWSAGMEEKIVCFIVFEWIQITMRGFAFHFLRKCNFDGELHIKGYLMNNAKTIFCVSVKFNVCFPFIYGCVRVKMRNCESSAEEWIVTYPFATARGCCVFLFSIHYSALDSKPRIFYLRHS